MVFNKRFFSRKFFCHRFPCRRFFCSRFFIHSFLYNTFKSIISNIFDILCKGYIQLLVILESSGRNTFQFALLADDYFLQFGAVFESRCADLLDRIRQNNLYENYVLSKSILADFFDSIRHGNHFIFAIILDEYISLNFEDDRLCFNWFFHRFFCYRLFCCGFLRYRFFCYRLFCCGFLRYRFFRYRFFCYRLFCCGFLRYRFFYNRLLNHRSFSSRFFCCRFFSCGFYCSRFFHCGFFNRRLLFNSLILSFNYNLFNRSLFTCRLFSRSFFKNYVLSTLGEYSRRDDKKDHSQCKKKAQYAFFHLISPFLLVGVMLSHYATGGERP